MYLHGFASETSQTTSEKHVEVVSLDGEIGVVAGICTLILVLCFASAREQSPDPVGFGGQLFQSAAVRATDKEHLSRQGTRRNASTAYRRSDISQPVPIPIPPISGPEQAKIADCLGSLDDLIAAEGRKLEALRQHKQGLMQQLFPQPGETVPRLRFPEFSEEGAWEETTIGNMGEVITGSTPSTSRRDFYGGDFMFVSPADISDLRFVEETKTTLDRSRLYGVSSHQEEQCPVRVHRIHNRKGGSMLATVARPISR